jgi:hypothetical protein
MTDYADVEIRLLERQKLGYPVELTVDGEQEYPRGYLDPGDLPWVPSASPDDDGRRLLAWLLKDDRLKTAWAEIRGQSPQRRIRLRIDPGAPDLHALPWELLRDDQLALAADQDTPFSRYLPIRLRWSGAVRERPIRVLVVLSDPSDLQESYNLPQLDLERERASLEAVFSSAGAGDLQADYLEAPATLARIEDALYNDKYHVLHYLGHGIYLPKRERAALYLQDDEGLTKVVYDDQLVSMLERQGIQPHLVFLAACQSATRSTTDAFLGMAPKLVTVGVPAVVAMQDRISVDSAKAFSARFYERLLDHGQVDLAANQARSALLTADRTDAAVPVLLMRLRSGQLWGDEADARGLVLGTTKPSVFWTTLVRQIQRGRCTPIVGPRVHGGVLPTLSQIAGRWADQHGYPFADGTEMAHVAQYMATSQGEGFPRDELLETLYEALLARLPEALRPERDPQTLSSLVQTVGWQNLVTGKPNEVHRALAALDLPLYLTTNADGFMTEALLARGRSPVRAICRWNEDLDELYSPWSEDADYEPAADRPLVYHILGSDEETDSLVLSENDFFRFLVRTSGERDRIPTYIRDKASSTSLMFLGYSLYDWELRVLMHGLVSNVAQRLRYKHVAVQLEGGAVGATDTEAVQTFM